MGRLQSIRAQDKGEQGAKTHTLIKSATLQSATDETYDHTPASDLHILASVRSVLYEICRPDNKPLTLMLPVNTSVQDVMSAVVKPGGDHILVKMNSTGGGPADVCV